MAMCYNTENLVYPDYYLALWKSVLVLLLYLGREIDALDLSYDDVDLVRIIVSLNELTDIWVVEKLHDINLSFCLLEILFAHSKLI